MKVRTIKLIQHDQPILLFSVPASQLISLCYFNPREVDREQGVQRPYKVSRSKEIAEYLETDESVLPNDIIVNLELSTIGLTLDDVFDSKSGDLDWAVVVNRASKRKGALSGKAAFVIDGQHRLRAFEHTSDQRFPVIVAAMLDLSLAQVAEIFVKINYYQKPVNKSLVFDLLGISPQLFPQYYVLHTVVEQLNEDVASPFYNSIKMLGIGGGFISQASMITAIEKYRVPELLRSLNVQPTKAVLYNVLWNYFGAVKKEFPSHWGERTRLCRTIGIRALVLLLKDVLVEISKQRREFSADNARKILRKINMDDVIEQTTGVGGEAGVTRFYEVMKKMAGV